MLENVLLICYVGLLFVLITTLVIWIEETNSFSND